MLFLFNLNIILSFIRNKYNINRFTYLIMGDVLNINDMAASAFNIIEQLSIAATKFVGLDSLYCRATP